MKKLILSNIARDLRRVCLDILTHLGLDVEDASVINLCGWAVSEVVKKVRRKSFLIPKEYLIVSDVVRHIPLADLQLAYIESSIVEVIDGIITNELMKYLTNTLRPRMKRKRRYRRISYDEIVGHYTLTLRDIIEANTMDVVVNSIIHELELSLSNQKIERLIDIDKLSILIKKALTQITILSILMNIAQEIAERERSR